MWGTGIIDPGNKQNVGSSDISEFSMDDSRIKQPCLLCLHRLYSFFSPVITIAGTPTDPTFSFHARVLQHCRHSFQ